MLLAKDSDFHFANARWPDILAKKPLLGQIFAASTTGAPADAYSDLMEDHLGIRLACLLNITTAMQQIFLPEKTPLDYFKKFDLPKLAPDRIFGYADAKLVDQVKLAAQHGQFDTEPAIDLTLHGDATSSFQTEAVSVKRTSNSRSTKRIGRRSTEWIASTWSPDIDYYKDTGAHLLLEVIPNGPDRQCEQPPEWCTCCAGLREGMREYRSSIPCIRSSKSVPPGIILGNWIGQSRRTRPA
jgi:hypothetical protein